MQVQKVIYVFILSTDAYVHIKHKSNTKYMYSY